MTSIWKIKVKLALLYIGSLLCSIAPLAVTLILKWDKYTATTPAATVKLCAGGVIAVVLIALAVLGKLKLPGRLVVLAVLLGLVYLLEPLLADLKLILSMALGGEVLDLVLFRLPIKRTKEAITVGKTANATTAQVEEVLKKYMGNGRV